MTNTLVVAKTEFGNVVGGVCPLAWKSPPSWQYFQDPEDMAFIFSTSRLLSGLKFRPFKKKFTIAMHKDYGPCFGEDIIIYDKANHSKMCWSNFPDVYTCREREVPHTLKVLKEFVGVEDHFKKFDLVEWEVYKISYSKEEEI